MNGKQSRLLASAGFAAFLFGSSPALAQSLGTAASFAVLGGSTVTNTGPSIIAGDLGVSPGSAVTGFPPGIVIGGTIHAADAVALQAQNDVTAAYNFLAGQACTTDLTGQDLGGLTLTPGVYCFSSSAQLTGTLTLNGAGLYIFQIGTTLTTASGSSVTLTNGASACDVWWQVGSSATLGTATSLPGNILALTSITLNTAASVSGRALARNGAVTLDGNTVSMCGNSLSAVQVPTLSEWGMIMLMSLLALVAFAALRRH
ncbi:MAG TPA: ice-binding family protein [Thermoanaerobaculia bacterium]|nr:ice-binding family protein [Thermoanaerobaculia bacterium]